MSDNTTKFTFRNLQDRSVELVIEPWGLVEDIPSGEIVIFEVNTAPLPEIEFSLTEEELPYVYVMSERVQIYVGGVIKHDFKTDIRPPAGMFHILHKVLFSK